MEDERIIIAGGNVEGGFFEQANIEYGGYCRAIARNILADGEDVRECVNDTWLGAWNAMPEDRPSRLGVYLGTITRRIALNRRKAASAAKRGGGQVPLALEELAQCVPASEDVSSRLELEALTAAVNGFVKGLPDAERRVFLCRYWYLDSIADIAGTFGFSQSKIKSMLARTRKKLLTYLRKEGFYDGR